MQSNLNILDNVPGVEFDRTPEEVRVQNLVDPLPHLKSGGWGGVYVDELVPVKNQAAQDIRFGPAGGFGQPRRVEPPPEVESPVLMLRTLDFTVESGRTYRYRARVVVRNREWKPGEKRIKRTEFGPWSEMTDVVSVP